MASQTKQAARELIGAALALGLPVFPCGANKMPCLSKKEGGNGFHDASLDPGEIERLFSHRGARLIGMPTGPASGWDGLDLDYRAGAAAFEDANRHRLPETRTHQTQSGGRHLLFIHAPGVRNTASKIAPGVDVRGEGGYVIMPPSRGYSLVSDAELCHWPDWLLGLVLKPKPAPTERLAASSAPREPISAARIERIVSRILDKVRTAPDGQKHYILRNQSILLGGIQHLTGYGEGEAVRLLTEALPSSVQDQTTAIKTAQWGIEQGRKRPIEIEDRPKPYASRSASPASAAPDEEPPPPITDEGYYASLEADAGARSDPVTTVIAELNARYMVVNEAGKAQIYAPSYDLVLKRERLDRMTFSDLRALYLNRLVQVGDDDKGRPIRKPIAEVWLHSLERRQFINGVTFDPSGKAATDGVLNLWKGFAVSPAPGDWSLMRSHIFAIICDSDSESFDYLMGWMARMLQFPAEQGEVAVVLKGGEGIGKGTLAKALMKISGHHALAISNSKHLTGNFNAHLRDVVFLFADEAFFAGDKAHVGALKSLITEPYLTVEAKYQNAQQMPNFLHVMMASNEEWVVPASLDARRFFVREVADAAKGNHAYFAAIWAQMEAGGYAAMLHEMLALDLTTFNVRAAPVTGGLQRQRQLSLGVNESWWFDVLHRGYVFRSKLGLDEYFGQWHEKVTTEVLFASYNEFADRRRERHPMGREAFGRFMRQMGAVPYRPRDAVIGEHITDVQTPFGSSRKAALITHPRPAGYDLGTIDASRAAFTEATGLPADWPEEDKATKAAA